MPQLLRLLWKRRVQSDVELLNGEQGEGRDLLSVKLSKGPPGGLELSGRESALNTEDSKVQIQAPPGK